MFHSPTPYYYVRVCSSQRAGWLAHRFHVPPHSSPLCLFFFSFQLGRTEKKKREKCKEANRKKENPKISCVWLTDEGGLEGRGGGNPGVPRACRAMPVCVSKLPGWTPPAEGIRAWKGNDCEVRWLGTDGADGRTGGLRIRSLARLFVCSFHLSFVQLGGFFWALPARTVHVMS